MVGKGKASGHHLASRVKKIMQKDEDVGKIAQATPVLICRAMELLLKKICERTFEIAANRQAKTVNASHVKNCVMSEETLDFLKETVAAAPDLAPEEGQPAKAAPKRRRSTMNADDSEDQAASPGDKPKRSRAPAGARQKKEKQEGAQDGAAAAPAPAKRRGRKKAQPDDTMLDAPQADAPEHAAEVGDSTKQSPTIPVDNAGLSTAAELEDEQQARHGELDACTGPDHPAAPSTSGKHVKLEDASADQHQAGQLSAMHSVTPLPAIPASVQMAVDVDDDYDDDYDDEA